MNLYRFGTNLEDALSDKGMSKKKFSEKMHVCQPTVSKWINGGAWPSMGHLEKISEVLGVPVMKLLEGCE